MQFSIVGEIREVETFASGRGVKARARLRKLYGGDNWRKRKGIAKIRTEDGAIWTAEVHWYEAHGVGVREMKFKRFID